MNAQELIRRLKDWVKRKTGEDLKLDACEEQILEYSLEGTKYKDMHIVGYAPSSVMYLKGPQLFQRIEELTEKEVNKTNCGLVLTRLLGQNDEEIKKPPTKYPRHNIKDFYGRSQELDDLEKWIVGECCRLVGIFGMTKIGKTELVKKLIENIKEQFQYVICKNLEDYPSLEEILTDIESCFSYINTESNINRRINNLINNYLNQHRCLLIFYHWEEVFKTSETPENQQQNCLNYERLLSKIGTEEHKSCLIFTSLRKPEIMNLISEGKSIRELTLAGFKNEEAKALLQDFGLSNPGLEQLINQYAGHPVALKIAAGIIQRHHNNQIDKFLEGTVFVSNILRNLLDKQFSYLSKLEIDIMQKLATEKEPKLLSQIYQYFPFNFQSEIILAVDKLWEIRLIEQEDIQDIRMLYSLNPLIEKYIRKHYNK